MLTIAVPTFNRVDEVRNTLLSLLGAELASLPVEVLVLDDGSTDGTYDRLIADETISANCRIIRNENNAGYARTFARLFDECTTEYLMVTSDDDRVATETLASLLTFLSEEKPGLLSTQFVRPGGILQRGKRVLSRITPDQVQEATSHAPGLVYRVADCQPLLMDLKRHIANNETAALVYPQVVLAMSLMAAGKECVWLPVPAVYEGKRITSGIRDEAGSHYGDVESRWRQIRSFNAILTQQLDNDPSGVTQELVDGVRARAFWVLARSISQENAALGEAFAQTAASTAVPRPIWRQVIGRGASLIKKARTAVGNRLKRLPRH